MRSRASGASMALAAGRGPKADRPATVKLEFKQVVAAVASLYDDQLKPFGRILLKRVGERSCAEGDGGSPPFVDARRLRRLCESCPRLLVEGQAGGEYVAMLRGRSPAFVDPADERDPYPEDLWQDMAVYFSEEGDGSRFPLPGGRYACARALMARGLRCLAGRSLGEVCHIVALAVAKRRVLGYSQGSTVPFWRSEASLKELCAAHQLPICSAKGASGLAVASWETARGCLWELLARAEARGSPGMIPVPNVKRLFRSQFQLELSETALGHSRLQDLLNDPKLSDLCEVKQCGSMNVVAKVGSALPPFVAAPTALCRATAGAGYFVEQPGAPFSSTAASAAGDNMQWHGSPEVHAIFSTSALGTGVPVGGASYLPQSTGTFCEHGAYYDASPFMQHAHPYAVAESAFCDQSRGVVGIRDRAPCWEPALPGSLWQLPGQAVPEHVAGYLATSTDDLALPVSDRSENPPPSCLTSASFFDFLLVQECPSHRCPFPHQRLIDKCPTESTATNSEGVPSDNEGAEAEPDGSINSSRSRRDSETLSETDVGHADPSGPLSDIEMTKEESDTGSTTNSPSSRRDSEILSDTEVSEAPYLRESFWDLMAQDEFGSPASVTKNTFIHIATDSISQHATQGAATRRRRQSVPCCARLNREGAR